LDDQIPAETGGIPRLAGDRPLAQTTLELPILAIDLEVQGVLLLRPGAVAIGSTPVAVTEHTVFIEVEHGLHIIVETLPGGSLQGNEIRADKAGILFVE